MRPMSGESLRESVRTHYVSCTWHIKCVTVIPVLPLFASEYYNLLARLCCTLLKAQDLLTYYESNPKIEGEACRGGSGHRVHFNKRRACVAVL
jgi:hypothetical protein